MEVVDDIVIVGAGIAGLATALGLHRMGLRSLVLESSESLRITGHALATWTNAWKALDALGIGDNIRQQHVQIQGVVYASVATGLTISETSFMGRGKCGDHEIRCVKRKLLIEVLENELPRGTIRFGSKVVSIEERETLKLVYLADGSVLKTKVLIGCDGVNSVVAKWLGLQRPVFAGRSAIRGAAELPEGHGLKPKLFQYFGDGFRSGFAPCDDKTVYWFFAFSPPSHEKDGEHNDPAKMKQFVLSKLHKAPKEVTDVLEKTELDAFISSPLRYRLPWNVLWGHTWKGTVCVAGDAFHPMTPDLGQGGCSALEDAVTLARCLGEALLGEPREEAEYDRIKRGVEKYAKERRWRGCELIATAYVSGVIQQSGWVVRNLLRNNFLAGLMAGMLLKKADFDCGKLYGP
ncbi:hypothetical protein MRB53_033312 [Persea americana]|uniref:Uncharacterized protein n=1 Tax=Persea americana TaxID=3435 RepID=A0ACC2KVC7_PERAE|nr:hypothetical protein MRB53_033312 [Persea americana]|eukprot:TRINITY_DN12403_c0_g1_i1.p1 TRINITY_DN12403_c0_g1~~TRINITY_DN12403_c0_g1_i1.p1  ORF type:complete len:406 (-),score=74.87 TRINITY_DN12403_c0_g1_i1:125-1342(-)